MGGQEGWIYRAETSTDVLGSNLFSTLVTIPKNSASLNCLSFFSMVYSLSLLVTGLGAGPPLLTVLIATRITLLVRIVRLSLHARVTL